jgi:Glycosyl transferase family 2
MPDVSLVINAHREGALAYPTIRSIGAMVDHAFANGLDSEVVVVFDRSDTETREVFARLRQMIPHATVISLDVDEGDLGAARMRGIAESTADCIAWVDADDLFSASWLTNAVATLAGAEGRAVVHPAWVVSFGQRYEWFPIKASRDAGLDLGIVPAFHPWTSMALTTREVVTRHPLTRNALREGFGPEDWHWNLETLADDTAHLVAPETALFYRLKHDGSLWQSQASRGVVLRPTPWLRDVHEAQRHARRRVEGSLSQALSRSQRLAQQFPALTLPMRVATKKLRHAAESSADAANATEPWLGDAVAQAIALEPEIPDARAYLDLGTPWRPQFDDYCASYWQAVQSFGPSIDRLFVASKHCDADEVARINEYATRHPNHRTALWCESPAVEMLGSLHSSVKVASATIDMEPRRGGARSGEQLLASLVVQLSPATLEVLHSAVGQRALAVFGTAMAQATKLELRLRALTRDAHGAPVSWYFDYPVDSGIMHRIEVASVRDAEAIHAITGTDLERFDIREN